MREPEREHRAEARPVHATGIVLGTQGLLFVGPAGSGKTILALATIESARRAGLFAALIGDDQVLIEAHGDVIVARRPPVIGSLAEIRGSGIVPVQSVPAAVVEIAVRPVALGQVAFGLEERIAPPDERAELAAGLSLPLIRLPYGDGIDPLVRLKPLIAATLGQTCGK
ncbi:hypothetical protein BJF92_09925 [Rhizobium rhizosphaerae]|uniref:HPr kinase/phosphorylase n=1 Tax=Xaviernesmea rhizosphaerae TaxID=1672749 RepID=A0A1Q9AGI7_9HYPH|nr:hypothetical protein [Xaviernesmea rhizosphaerae]OLP54046.1 hypothetical protein BJF92_09925 [Xaviernesmea rhizosphaerae]OQP86175.1 hypothetical protein BTR14_12375 [Xaviernesmea rhizosphaerae]